MRMGRTAERLMREEILAILSFSLGIMWGTLVCVEWLR
jgi:hypothetical protein